MNKISTDVITSPSPFLFDSDTQHDAESHLDTITDAFRAAMDQHCLEPEDDIIGDGDIHRIRCENDKPGRQSGWYSLHLDERPAGVFGCHRCDLQQNWSFAGNPRMTDQEREQRQAAMEAMRQEREAAKLRADEDCATRATTIWNKAAPVTSHPYLARKGIQPHDARLYQGALVLPVRTTAGNVVGLQFISEDGTKRFLKGTPKAGNLLLLHSIPKDAPRILICEGFATGATLHEVTGLPVVVAFDAGNLLPVAEQIRARRPEVELILCADNDHRSDGNTGLLKATEAAQAVRGRLAIPDFPADSTGTDFNDLLAAVGPEAVQEAVNNAATLAEPPALASRGPRHEFQDIGGRTYRVGDDGIFVEVDEDSYRQVSSTIKVVAATRDYASNAWGRLLAWRDRDGVAHEWAMPMELLQGDGVDLRKTLADQGVLISPMKAAREQLLSYLGGWHTEEKARCVSRLGWEAGVYVIPSGCIGDSDERIVYQHSQAIQPAMTQQGSLAEWNTSIGVMAVGNSRLVFAIATALAAPMALLANVDSGGFNIRGRSSSGKSTALKVAASVWGRPDRYCRNWRATTNGLEGLALLHNDSLLILDELSQIDPSQVGDAAYMLANGQGKARASRNGDTKPPAQWRLLFLSAGEVSLTTLMQSAGKTANAGQEIRMADIPADAGANMGALEEIHGAQSPAKFAEALSEATSRYHGTVGIAWLHYLVATRLTLQGDMATDIQHFVDSIQATRSSGQISRVARRFGLVAIAGEIAAAANIVEWPRGEATRAAVACFNAWLDEFGGTGNCEDSRIIARLRLFMQAHGSSRFERCQTHAYDQSQTRTVNRAGFIKSFDGADRYWLLPEVFNQEICRGIDHRQAEQALVAKGYIQAGSERVKMKLYHDKISTRAYLLTNKIWEDEEQ